MTEHSQHVLFTRHSVMHFPWWLVLLPINCTSKSQITVSMPLSRNSNKTKSTAFRWTRCWVLPAGRFVGSSQSRRWCRCLLLWGWFPAHQLLYTEGKQSDLSQAYWSGRWQPVADFHEPVHQYARTDTCNINEKKYDECLYNTFLNSLFWVLVHGIQV